MTVATRQGATDEPIRIAPPPRGRVAMLAKRLVQAVFLLVVLPRLCCYWLCRAVVGREAFGASSESVARIPGRRGVYLRQAFYRQTLSSCGQDAYFGWLSAFSMPEAEVGDRVYIGRNCSIGFGVIGDEVMLADGVQILSGGSEHDEVETDDTTMHDMPQTFRPVHIGRGAWLGAGAIVMADVGKGAVVGAGAVVTRPIPDRCVAVGVPARVIQGGGET